MSQSTPSVKECILVVDVDGTLIPVLIDFEKLRDEIRRLIRVKHPLRPLGESLATLNVSNNLKREAWSLIERAELESLNKLRVEDVQENVESLARAARTGARVVLVSMRSRASVEQVISMLRLNGVVSLVVARDHSPSRLGQLRLVLETYPSSRVVFLGDTAYDEEAARALDIGFIMVKDYKYFSTALEKALEVCRQSSTQ